MSKVQVTQGLRCPKCEHEPFRSRAGLGAHMSAKHHLRIDGSPAVPKNGQTREVVITIEGRQIRVPMSSSEIRRLLIDHPEAAADALLAS